MKWSSFHTTKTLKTKLEIFRSHFSYFTFFFFLGGVVFLFSFTYFLVARTVSGIKQKENLAMLR